MTSRNSVLPIQQTETKRTFCKNGRFKSRMAFRRHGVPPVYGYYITKPKATAFGKRRKPLAVPQYGGFVDTTDGNATGVLQKTAVSKAEWLFGGVLSPPVYGYYITKPKAVAFGRRRKPLAVPQYGGFVDTIDGNETAF